MLMIFFSKGRGMAILKTIPEDPEELSEASSKPTYKAILRGSTSSDINRVTHEHQPVHGSFVEV
jgi:hypothetical protein